MSLNQQKWVFNYLIREKIWKKQKTILTPKCHGHRWVCLLIINEITELDSSVSMTPLSLSARYQWHRWDWLRSVDNITEFFVAKSIISTKLISYSKIYLYQGQNHEENKGKNISEHCPYNVKRRNQWILRKDSKDVIKL